MSQVVGPRYLADKSALARLHHEAVAAVLAPLLETGQVATSSVLELEILFSARSHRDFIETRAELGGYTRLPTDQVDFDRAIVVMEALAKRGYHRAAGLPDLLQAAVAERHGVTLLHYDGDFDTIASVTDQSVEWVVKRGSVP